MLLIVAVECVAVTVVVGVGRPIPAIFGETQPIPELRNRKGTVVRVQQLCCFAADRAIT